MQYHVYHIQYFGGCSSSICLSIDKCKTQIDAKLCTTWLLGQQPNKQLDQYIRKSILKFFLSSKLCLQTIQFLLINASLTVSSPMLIYPGQRLGNQTRRRMHQKHPFSNTPSQRNNLTLHDWLHVRNWYDNNQLVSQAETVSHFKNLPDNALLFTQGMLSRHLTKKGCEQDDTRLASTPSALSSK